MCTLTLKPTLLQLVSDKLMKINSLSWESCAGGIPWDAWLMRSNPPLTASQANDPERVAVLLNLTPGKNYTRSAFAEALQERLSMSRADSRRMAKRMMPSVEGDDSWAYDHPDDPRSKRFVEIMEQTDASLIRKGLLPPDYDPREDSKDWL